MITCENLVKIYTLNGVEILALQGLELAVESGEMLGIVGSSGSGKTTLLNVLGGLDRPTAGKVRVGERDLLKMSGAELDVYRRTQVGFVWQQTTRNLIPYLSALENVEMPLRLARCSATERRRRALELLEALGLSQRIHHQPGQLSGGEQQRVAIAVALVNRPLVLLADEPTGELDTATALEIYTALRQMNELYRITTLIVSHDPNINRYTDRVVIIRDGKTSTETVQPARAGSPVSSQKAGQEIQSDESHTAVMPDELVILDSAGRLQIPREYLEALDIGDRVRLELEGSRVIIHPVAGRGRSQPEFAESDDLYVDVEDAAPQVKRSAWFKRMDKINPSRGKNEH